jgi:hypothetical protein
LIGVDGRLLRSALDYFKSAGITFGSLVESLTITEHFVLMPARPR